MKQGSVIKAGLAVMLLGIAALTVETVHAAETASEADRDFVGKVSQGGLYEVEAGKVAAMRATSPVVKNFGILESHDHEGVNRSLKIIADATSVSIAPKLNEEFSQRLEKLKATRTAEFDAYYIGDMKQIHTKDEALFVQEAQGGTGPYKAFAHQTAVLVKAHLGWLGTL